MCSKVDTCYNLNGSNTIEHYTQTSPLVLLLFWEFKFTKIESKVILDFTKNLVKLSSGKIEFQNKL